MSTQQQRAAVDKLVEIGGTSVSRAMRESRMPYSPKTAHTPSKLTESKGFQELMEEYGLTRGLIARALVNDIKKKPKNRAKELNLGAEILSMKESDEYRRNTVNIIVIPSEVIQKRGINQSAKPNS